MLMSVAEITSRAEVYPELAGARVLITGIGPTCGVDISRAFAEHGCRLVLQIPEPCPETDALLQIIAQSALDVSVHHDALEDAQSATRFTQKATQIYGSFENVINLISISRYDLNSATTLEQIETLFTERLQAACRATRVAANRMGLTWVNGSILNVLRLPAPTTSGEAALAGIARTALAAMTRSEAGQWSEHGVRVNAIAPRATLGAPRSALDDCMRSEPEIAAVALYLASAQGAAISGCILDCDGHSGSA
jgi:NAD(P)-dependent dehydrogenase (short-subunit alcohol dehydrogenase family)